MDTDRYIYIYTVYISICVHRYMDGHIQCLLTLTRGSLDGLLGETYDPHGVVLRYQARLLPFAQTLPLRLWGPCQAHTNTLRHAYPAVRWGTTFQPVPTAGDGKLLDQNLTLWHHIGVCPHMLYQRSCTNGTVASVCVEVITHMSSRKWR